MGIALAAAALGLVVLGLAAGSRGPRPGARGRQGQRAPVPVRLTVDTNLPVHVTALHPPDERVPEASTDLGESVREADGAHAGDTLVLTNPIHGLRYEVQVPSGVDEVRVVKEFRTGHVLFRGIPADERSLFVYLNDLQVAPYSAGVKIELVEGPHTLEIRGADLPEPLKVDVEVYPGQTVSVDPPAGLKLAPRR